MDTFNFSPERSFLRVMTEIGSIAIFYNIAYYLFLPALGLGNGFAANPVQITVYYLFWLILTLYSFEEMYKPWVAVYRNRKTWIIVSVASLCIVLYLTYILPLFPPIQWVYPFKPPSELLTSSVWYFLPKSFDILLQQLLVLAMVLAFQAQKYSLSAISIWCAVLFGGSHLLMVLGGSSPLYTTLFTVSAILASFVFPYLILKVRNGFVYSYILHWLFYAVVIVVVRLLFKV